MVVKIFLYFLTFVAISTLVKGKTYKRTKFIQELVEKYSFTLEDAVKAACVAKISGFRTHNLRTFSYGIFNINVGYLIQPGRNIDPRCKDYHHEDFLDDDITDDIDCFKRIAPNLTDSDWRRPWKHEIDPKCSRSDLGWKSLDDCWTYPSLSVDPVHQNRRFDIEFPHAAAIGWSDPKSKTINWNCGGSLISEDTILTAAHCLKFEDVGLPDVVRLGDWNLETDTDERNIQQFEHLTDDQFTVHPAYKKIFNDIALIKLKTKVKVTKFVIPACVWDKKDLLLGVKLEAAGFEKTNYRGTNSPSLIKVFLSAISTEECKYYFGKIKSLKEETNEEVHLCATDITGKSKDNINSGGPLEMKLDYGKAKVSFIVGVTSFGLSNIDRTTTVYARVSSYIDWIKKLVPDLELNAIECSKKYEKLRFIERPEREIDFSRLRESQKLVFGDQVGQKQKTLATIISDQFLIAAASNLKKISNPKTVLFQLNGNILIEKILYHPNYVNGNPENDLALIKLKSRIIITDLDRPSCVPQKFVNVDLNKGSISQIEKVTLTNSKTKQSAHIIDSEIANCLAKNGTNSDWRNTEKLTCFKTASSYHVPGYCTVPVGSAIFYQPFNVDFKSLIKGFVIESHDCTFTLVTDLSKHYEWINSIAFGSEED